MTIASSAEDASYHSRHGRRSKLRAECIAAHLDGPVTVLDVGCNQGITSRYLLEAGIAEEVTGVELSAGTVSETLKRDSRFSLIEGDISKIALPRKYDVCIYGAVHHHVFCRYGLGVAVAVLQSLAASSKNVLFFETGHLCEGGRWKWQRAIREYFRTDEAHLYYLMSCIEHLIDDFSVIGRFRIHGISRWLIKVNLSARATNAGIVPESSSRPFGLRTGEPYGRRFGSSTKHIQVATEESCNSPVLFRVGEAADGSRFFLKRHVHRPFAAATECGISRQIPFAWAVRCIEFQRETGTLLFPYIADCTSVLNTSGALKKDRDAVAKLILRIFKEAGEKTIRVESRVLLPIAGTASVLQLCDFNPNNVLASRVGSGWSLRVVDFEQQSRNYIWRNRMHFGRLLLGLRSYVLLGLFQYAAGLVGGIILLLAYQTRSPEVRIRHRQPGILSVIVTEVRSVSGRLVAAVLRRLGIE